jgi:hypothetical protein
MLVRLAIAVLALSAIGQVAFPFWRDRDVLVGQLVDGQRFPFSLENAATGEQMGEGCRAVSICSVDCHFCRQYAQETGAESAEWMIMGDSNAAAAFAAATGLSSDNLWLPTPIASGEKLTVSMTGMKATPTSVVLVDGIITRLITYPDPPVVGAALAALCDSTLSGR